MSIKEWSYILMYSRLRERVGVLERAAAEASLRHPEDNDLRHALWQLQIASVNCETRDLLGDRQLEFARLYARGLSIAQAARKMGIAERTAQKHRNDVFRRLGVDSKLEMAYAMIAHGLLPIPTITNLEDLKEKP